jgi:hypothetical protein
MSTGSQLATADVTAKIKRISAQKLEDSSSHNSKVVFNVGVNMDETSRRSDSVGLSFEITLETEPSIAKISIEGVATITGNQAAIDKILTQDSGTNAPRVLAPIYEEIYPVLFMLVGTLDLPYPSPALLKRSRIRSPKQ